MHSVNLAVQDTISNVPEMRNFLQFVHELIKFIKDSPKRCQIVREIAVEMECAQTHVRPLCPTRFTVKFKALEGLQRQLPILPQVLTAIEDQSRDRSISSRASGFKSRLSDFEFYFFFVVCKIILEITDDLSKVLQSGRVSAGEGIHMINSKVNELEKLRCEEKFEMLWQRSLALAKEM